MLVNYYVTRKKGGGMNIKSQLKVLKDNWLIILIILALLIIVGGLNFNIPSTFNLSTRDMDMIDEDYAIGSKPLSSIAPSPQDSGSFSPDIAERILTQSAYLNSEVRRGQFQTADEKLKDIVKTSGSFLLNENVIKHDSQFRKYYSGNYRIQVETSKYNSITNQLKELGEVQEFSENVDDVTDGYTKLEIELGAERERLSRYEALYKQAGSIEDKLSLSDRIYNQERTIKYYEDRLANLDERVDYSNIEVQLSEKHSEYAGVKFISFGNLVNNIVQGLNNLLSIIFFLVPYALLAWAIYYGFVWWKKRR